MRTYSLIRENGVANCDNGSKYYVDQNYSKNIMKIRLFSIKFLTWKYDDKFSLCASKVKNIDFKDIKINYLERKKHEFSSRN